MTKFYLFFSFDIRKDFRVLPFWSNLYMCLGMAIFIFHADEKKLREKYLYGYSVQRCSSWTVHANINLQLPWLTGFFWHWIWHLGLSSSVVIFKRSFCLKVLRTEKGFVILWCCARKRTDCSMILFHAVFTLVNWALSTSLFITNWSLVINWT